MYKLEINEEVDRIFKKLSKKNPHQLRIINKKVNEILENPTGYKFLKKPLHGYNRVHINSHFVLIFKVDNEKNVVILCYFDHHDLVYKWRPNE